MFARKCRINGELRHEEILVVGICFFFIQYNIGKGRCNYGVDIFQIQQPDYFFLEVKTITKIAVKWDC